MVETLGASSRGGDSQKTILIVTNERKFRGLLRDFAQSLGYLCAEADSAPRALDLLRKTHLPIVVSDSVKPEMDGFKRFNDRYGHLHGDALLKTVATVLGLSLSENVDFAFRYGGDEFVVILPEADGKTASPCWQNSQDGIGRFAGSVVYAHSLSDANLLAGVKFAEFLIRTHGY